MAVQDVRRGSGQDASSKVPSVADIEAMDRDDLVSLWPALIGGMVPRAISQGVMRRFLAFDAQAQVSGGLSRADAERLERLSVGRARAVTTKMAAGARFLREWNGITHVVERTEGGYRWNGRVFASLSGIAKEITGAHWSGPRFFGVKAGSKVGEAVIRPAQPGRKASAP